MDDSSDSLDPNRTIQVTLDRTFDLANNERNRPTLTVLTGPSFGLFHAVEKEITVIGRSAEADLKLDDASISRAHARLVRRGGEFFVEDLGSSNGSFVNGEPADPTAPLQEGAKITLGKVTMLRFSYGDAVDEAFQRRLFDAALRDGLTQAFNKRYLMERLAMELSFSRRHGTPLSLLIFDLDRFKSINDTYGHLAGDQVLVEVARVVHNLIREEDILGRYGGEEFVVVCRGTAQDSAGILAERLREEVAHTAFIFEKRRLPVTVSIGVAGYPHFDATTPSDLIAAADRALYRAKESGRNRVVFHSA